MLILIDIEWLKNDQYHRCPTQLAAVAVDRAWEISDSFYSRIRPRDESFHDWGNVAYTGGTAEDFLSAPSVYTVLSDFNGWLREEDTLGFWNQHAADVFTKIQKNVAKIEVSQRTVILSEYIEKYLNGEKYTTGSPYFLARIHKIATPTEQHHAQADAITMCKLLRGLKYPQDLLLDESERSENESVKAVFRYDPERGIIHRKGCPQIPKGSQLHDHQYLITAVRKKCKPCTCVADEYYKLLREQNMDSIRRSSYLYVYAECSKVFHRFDCRILPSVTAFSGGCRYEKLVSGGRRPCKICNPQPSDIYLANAPRSQALDKLLTERRERPFGTELPREAKAPVKRLFQCRIERFSGILETPLTEQQRTDLFTLTQPKYTFFAAHGYRTFHLRSCKRMEDLVDIEGFERYERAIAAGYRPCKYCKPSEKDDLEYSIPFDNMIRLHENVDDLIPLCRQAGFPYKRSKTQFMIETPVGRWRIYTKVRPVVVDHINLVKEPGNSSDYHRQPRMFLSLVDTFRYIKRHDEVLEKKNREEDV